MKNILLALCTSLFCVSLSYAQVPDLVPTDGISGPLHQANIGKVVFLPRRIPLNELKATDFLTTYELNRHSNLSIRVFLDNSIINYQHQLVPGLSADSLNVSGNYQFSFLIDNKLIYKENIHYGCGLKKSTTTTFSVPFTDTQGADSWAIYLWDRFMQHGGQKALTVGTHQLKVELRPYVKSGEQAEAQVGDLLAAGDLRLIIKTPKVTASEMAIQPIQPGTDWTISRATYNRDKIRLLNKNIALNTYKSITSIVVIKDGKLLLEEYFNGATRNTLHDTRSVGKSFASALMGMAIRDGYIKSEDQVLRDFYNLKQFANYAPQKDSVHLRDLLTMSSAFNGSDQVSDSPGNEENMYPTDNWVKFALDLPMDPQKTNGKQWDYFTAGVVLLGDILDKSVPGGLEKYAAEKLFQPMGIQQYEWQYTPQHVVNTAGGLQLSALDYAKIGQLYRNKGAWKGQQVLPATWVDKTFTQYLPLPGAEQEFYGYLFWNKTFKVNGKSYETYYCAGNGGNKVFIFKDLPIVVVVTAKAYNRPYAHPQVDEMMERYILPAVVR